MIDMDSEKRSSVLSARHDDDDYDVSSRIVTDDIYVGDGVSSGGGVET